MADLSSLNFKPETTEDVGEGGFRVIPPGTYIVMIVASEIQNTKAGNGKMLVLTYQIIEGREVGGTLIDRINIVNPSETAQKIGLSQLKKICDAVGHKGQLKDSNQLHGKPFAVKVVVEEFESNKDGKMLQSNKVESRMPKSAAAAAPPPAASGEAPQQAPLAW